MIPWPSISPARKLDLLKLFSLIMLITLPAATPLAQGRGPAGPPDLQGTYDAEASYVGESDIHRGSESMGDMSTRQYRASYLHNFRVSTNFLWRLGAAWQRFDFDLPSGAPLPEALQSIALRFGSQWRIGPRWTFTAEAAPGIYSDFEDISLDDVNVPVTVGVLYTQNPRLSWIFGLRADLYSEIPVLPGFGVRWRFAEDWTLSMILPRPRIEFAATEQLTLFAGGELKGGGYRVGRDFGDEVGIPELNNETVGYREIRAGGGARYNFSRHLALSVDGGWAIDRRFTFDNEDRQFNGDGAPFIQLGLSGGF